MNSWLLLRRLRGPAFLILVGFTALLNQWGVLSFGHSWPLYLILAGIFGLVERAVMAAAPPPSGYPGAYAPGSYGQGYGAGYGGPYPSGPGYTSPGIQPAPGQPANTDTGSASGVHDALADPDRRS
jgi:hypothetical protein